MKKSIFFVCLVLYIANSCNDPSSPVIPVSNLITISGRVINDQNQLPVFNAIVKETRLGLKDTTNLNGEFVLDSIPSGIDTFKVIASGYNEYSEIINLEELSIYTDFNIIPTESSGSFVLYAGNFGADELFIIDLIDNTVTDTILGFESIYQITVSEDGHLIFVSSQEGPVNYPGKLRVMSMPDREINIILNNATDVLLSPQGIIFLVIKKPHNPYKEIGIYNEYTNGIEIIDTLNIGDERRPKYSVVFDPKNPIFYTVNNGGELYAYNFIENKIEKTYQCIKNPGNMIISNDGRYIFISGGPVVDLYRDSLVAHTGGNVGGAMAFDRDYTYLFMTDPGGYLFPPSPSGKILVYDVNNYHIGEYIDIGNKIMTDYLVLHPKKNLLYINSWTDIYIIDIDKREVVNTIRFTPINLLLHPMAIGLKF